MAGLALGPMGWPGYRHGSLGLTRPRKYRSGGGGRRRMQYRSGRFKGKKSRRSCLLGLNPEKKFLDFALSATPTATGTLTNLSTIAQGDGESDRIGRKAIITDIMLKGHIILLQGTSAAASNRVRLVIVQDKQTNGANFTTSDLFNIAGTADINAYRDLSHIGRFQVLYDKIWTINPQFAGDGTTDVSADAMRDVHINLKCCIPIEYDNSVSTGAVSSQQVNSVWLVSYEEVATPATIFQHVARIRYVD